MKALIEKYKARQKIKETKAYEEWKKTKGKSTTKVIFLFSLMLFAIPMLIKPLMNYFYGEIYTLRQFRIDFVFALLFGIIGGSVLYWDINRKYRQKLNEERIN